MTMDHEGVAELENAGMFDIIGSYKNHYRDLHNKNVTEYFDSLVEMSKIDIEQNRETNRKIRETGNRVNELNARIRKRTAVKVLLIVLTVVSVLVVIGEITLAVQTGQLLLNILIAFLGAVLGGLFIFLIIKLSPKTKELKAERGQLEEKVRALTEEAWQQMRPLNELFAPRMSPQLFKRTMPYINLDKMFDRKRLDYFVRKFGLDEARDDDDDRSTQFVQSGDIDGNPFFICTDLVHELGTKTYTGSITIHWTTTRHVNGKSETVHHTQVLTASVEKPCPYYNEETYLVYGNEAAPDLIFTRRDSDAEHMNQKQIDKFVDRKIKKLQKQAERSVSGGGGYTVMGNSEFEVLFGAHDRNNEVQFRLLFTPLAQKQLLQIMKEKEAGYGDDFGFVKYKMLNYIYPQHLNAFDLSVAPGYFYGFDFDAVRGKFISYNNEYFRQLYFAFAPVLAIPLYQQQKPHEFIYKELYDSFASFYEHEFVANNLTAGTFAHPQSATPSILKTEVVGSDKRSDTVKVTAYGYRTVGRVDHVNKLGGDGRIHTIPVHWTEYIPVQRDTDIVINALDEEEETSYAGKLRQSIENIKNKKIDEKDIFRVGAFLTYILKD